MRGLLLLLVTLTACDDGGARTDLEDPGGMPVTVIAPDDTDALTATCGHLRNPECLHRARSGGVLRQVRRRRDLRALTGSTAPERGHAATRPNTRSGSPGRRRGG